MRIHGRILRIAAALGLVTTPASAARGEDAPFTLKPAADYRAELEAMLTAGQPTEGDNAWDHLFAAIAAANLVNEQPRKAEGPEDFFPSIEVDEMRFDPLRLDDRTLALDYLQRLDEAGVWSEVDSAGAARRAVSPFPWGGARGGMSEMQIERNRLRVIGMAAIAAMRVAHARSDDGGVRAMAARCVTLAGACASVPDWLAVILGSTQCTLVCREICQEIMERPYSDALLAAVDAELARIDPMPSPEGWLAALPVVERFAAASDTKLYTKTIGDPAAVIPIVDAVTALALSQLDRPMSTRERPGAGWGERLMAHLMATKDMGDDLEGRMDLIPIAERVQGMVDSTLDVDACARTMLAGTRTVIAIERYRIAKGALPDSLDALVPAYLSAVPTDPMTGKPMLYTRIKRDPHGRVYLAYSTGIDGVDNGGREPAGEMYPNPTDIEGGFDFIVNQPLRSLTK